MDQPTEDADKLYKQNLAIVLDFFVSKLQLYYSSSRLTLLLTFLLASMGTYIIPLPSRLKIVDNNALSLHNAGGYYREECYWQIFQDFLDSSDPLALDEKRYAFATLACLKILFGHYHAPILHVTWFSQHSRALGANIKDHSKPQHTDLPAGTDWRRSVSGHRHLRTHFLNRMPQRMHLSGANTQSEQMRIHISQTIFDSSWKSRGTLTIFSNLLVVGYSGSDTYLENIQHI